MVSFKKYGLLLRVHQWSKAVFVFLGVIYARNLSYLPDAFLTALSFCLVASVVYIYNDLQDIEEDKAHPRKARRPIASDNVTVFHAIGVLLLCLVLGFSLGFFISKALVVIFCVYLLINLAYNHGFRDIPLLDVLCVASGFMLRILAGTIGIGLPITWWLTITATLLSLLIALCKRRLEMQLQLTNYSRSVLKKYHPRVLDLLIVSTGSSCFISYLLYTIYARQTVLYFIATIPFSAFGLWRFVSLTEQESKNDDPILLFLSDNLSCFNLLCFATLTILALL